jgi:hypothetical protein
MSEKIRDAIEAIEEQREFDERLDQEFRAAIWPDPSRPKTYTVEELSDGKLGISVGGKKVCVCHVKNGRIIVMLTEGKDEYATVDEATSAVATLIANVKRTPEIDPILFVIGGR